MPFLLPTYYRLSHRERVAPAAVVIPPPENLRQELLKQGQDIVDTVADGNCGLDAFGHGLASVASRNRRLYQTEAYKKFSKAKTAGHGSMMLHLRQACIDQMMKMKDTKLWDGVDFKSLAVMMSSEKEDFSSYIERMGTDRCWVDASALHALGCHFRIDVLIWQENVDPSIVGHSFSNCNEEPLAMISVVMVNDFHFWGVVDTTLEDARPLRGLDPPAHPPQWNYDSDDDRDKLQRRIGEAPKKRSVSCVEAELAVCQQIAAWEPWNEPSADLVLALRRYSGLAPDNETVGHQCLLRQSVIDQLAYERNYADSLPERLKYNAGSRWKLGTGIVAPRTAKRELMTSGDGHDTLSLEKIKDRIAVPCATKKHTCLARFVEAPESVRVWRILWNSLPASTRREHLMVMYKKGLFDSNNDKLSFQIMGYHVCKPAWLKITGIGNWSLTEALKRVNAGHMSSCSRREVGIARNIEANPKDAKYLDARAWLEHYASKFGDHSPTDFVTYIPKGRKSALHALYAHERTCQNREYASVAVFLAAWRFELPWLIMAPALCKFVHCGVCDFLRDQIDRCPRSSTVHLNALIDRLGAHFKFQSAQRLKMDEISEHCNQSEGKKWFVKVDKMDQNAVNLPQRWSMQRTQLFRQGDRVQVSVIGSWWSGLTCSSEINLRTVFEDCKHGADMQISTVMQSFHEKVIAEGHLPEEFFVGADNTPKETKNNPFCWWLIWLLCVLDGTCLWSCGMLFLIVGHTHDKIDRLFSRLRAAITGHDFDTVEKLVAILQQRMPGFDFDSSHLSRVWNWSSLKGLDLPAFKGLPRVHALNFFRSRGGIYVKWKQYLTSDDWSRPVLIVPADDMARVADWKPDAFDMRFNEKTRNKTHAWLNRVETALVDVSTDTSAPLPNFQYLKDLVDSKLPQFWSTLTVEQMIYDLKNARDVADPAVRGAIGTMPVDVLVPLFPGADHPEVPVDTLIEIPKRWEPTPCKVLGIGSMVICRVPPGTTISVDRASVVLPFLLANVIDVKSGGDVAVQWWIPGTSPILRFGGGKRRDIIDVFSAWTPSSMMQLGDVAESKLPNIIVNLADLLHVNVELTDDKKLPYSVFDSLWDDHLIDLTAYTYSQTSLGVAYRTHVHMTRT